MNKQTKELLNRNNELDKKLSSGNQEVLTDFICYLRGSNISQYNQEVIRQDLLEMVLSAQERGEDIRTVIGEDYKEFCDNIIASIPPATLKERILDFIDIVLLCTVVFWGCTIVLSLVTDHIIEKKPLRYELTISMGTFVSYILTLIMAYAIVQIFCKTSLSSKEEHKHNKSRIIMLYFFIGAGIIAILLLTAWIGKGTFFHINIFAAAIVLLVFYILHRLLD